MATRAGMRVLIDEVRTMTALGPSDYSVDNENLWSDERLQDALDLYRVDAYRENIAPVETQESGTVVYKEYPLPGGHWEKTTGGTSIFYIQHADGTNVTGSNYTVDYNRGHVTFTNDTSGSVFYLYGRKYDMYGAAAHILRRAASYYMTAVNFSTDNHSISQSQIIQNILMMAEQYERRSGAAFSVTTMYRGDVEANP